MQRHLDPSQLLWTPPVSHEMLVSMPRLMLKLRLLLLLRWKELMTMVRTPPGLHSTGLEAMTAPPN